MKHLNLYVYFIILLIFILPIGGTFIEKNVLNSNKDLLTLFAKWFVFSTIGIRLFSAGLRQIFNPQFTVEKIFNLTSKENQILVRELGFASCCVGLLGVLSIFSNQFLISAAITGGLYLGLAGVYHLIKKPVTINEKIAMISDLIIFLIMILIILEKII